MGHHTRDYLPHRYTPEGSSGRRIVAVKYLRKELFKNAEDLELFRNEVVLMKKLRNRYVPCDWTS